MRDKLEVALQAVWLHLGHGTVVLVILQHHLAAAVYVTSLFTEL